MYSHGGGPRRVKKHRPAHPCKLSCLASFLAPVIAAGGEGSEVDRPVNRRYFRLHASRLNRQSVSGVGVPWTVRGDSML